MKKDIITSAIGILVLTVLLGIVYPLVVTGVSQVAFPGNANAQKLYVGGKLVGSKIIGQEFADQVVKNGKPQVDKNGNPVTTPDPKYFQTRPSATVPPDKPATAPQFRDGVQAFGRLKAAVQKVIWAEWRSEANGLMEKIEAWAAEFKWVTRRERKKLTELQPQHPGRTGQ